MRLKVTKPRDGKTTVVLDDRGGLTGFYSRLTGVDVANFQQVVEPEAAKWEEARKRIRDARRPQVG